MSWFDLVRKDLYFGDNDPNAANLAYQQQMEAAAQNPDAMARITAERQAREERSSQLENLGSGRELGYARNRTPFFGTNLSEVGRKGKDLQELDWFEDEDEMEDYYTDMISEIEAHESTHQAMKPALRDAANEERQRRIQEAKKRGIKVLRDDESSQYMSNTENPTPQLHRGGQDYYESDASLPTEPSFFDKVRRKKTANERAFNVKPGQMSEWEEKGAATAQFYTPARSDRPWASATNYPYSSRRVNPAGFKDPRATHDPKQMRDMQIDRGYEEVQRDREQRQKPFTEYYDTGRASF